MTHSKAALATCLVLLLSLGIGCREKPDERPQPKGNNPKNGSGPAKVAQTQGEALRLAREQDLPAIRQADRLVIKMASWAGSKQVVVRNPPWLAKINSALVLRQVSPSLGENWAALTWYKGDKKIRAAWVFKYGEWGFERPSTDWSLGSNEALAKVIREALAEPAATQPAG